MDADSDKARGGDELYQATLPPKEDSSRPDEFKPWPAIVDPRRDGDLSRRNP